MEFDVKRIYTAVNAEEVKVGSKVICGDNISILKKRLEGGDVHIHELTSILAENLATRFRVKDFGDYALCYLVSEPKKKTVKWIDLKIGDVIKKGTKRYIVIGIEEKNSCNHILAGQGWLSDEELEEWEKVEE